ncbi:MAG: hypothetical protein CVU29_03775 [Betaproteobacteria bacterium HGW-Betaproteobacteria-22]|nr:MAG: hypothetical protein CVU29_03775 [Betaproteobacteria bacterium HGW-Betaproteobacteria-22]
MNNRNISTLEEAYIATTDAMDEMSSRVIENFEELAQRGTQFAAEQTSPLTQKTLENSTDNLGTQAVIDDRLAESQPNVAVTYAAMTQAIEQSNDFTPDQKKIIEARIKEIALAQEKDIAQEDMRVARVEQQPTVSRSQDREL